MINVFESDYNGFFCETQWKKMSSRLLFRISYLDKILSGEAKK